MKLIYRTSDRVMAQLMASALETHEIGALVDGEHLSPLQGLAVPAGACAEYRVFITDPEQRPRAEHFVRDWLRQHEAAWSSTESWTCRSCGEAHEGQFSSCWSCGAERDTC